MQLLISKIAINGKSGHTMMCYEHEEASDVQASDDESLIGKKWGKGEHK